MCLCMCVCVCVLCSFVGVGFVFLCLCVCVPVGRFCVCVCAFVVHAYLPACQSVYLFVCLLVCLSVCLSVLCTHGVVLNIWGGWAGEGSGTLGMNRVDMTWAKEISPGRLCEKQLMYNQPHVLVHVFSFLSDDFFPDFFPKG